MSITPGLCPGEWHSHVMFTESLVSADVNRAFMREGNQMLIKPTPVDQMMLKQDPSDLPKVVKEYLARITHERAQPNSERILID